MLTSNRFCWYSLWNLVLRNLESWYDTKLIYLDRNDCWRLISTVLLSMPVSSLNHHLKKRIRLGKVATQIDFLLCISAGLMLSSVSAALWWKGGVSTAFVTSIFLAFSKSIDNNKADSDNSYKGSNQISSPTLCRWFHGWQTIVLSSRTIWYYMIAVQWAWIMTYSQAGKYAETSDLH